MSFDISRFTFNPWKDFSGVVMQQGRVQLDSDWNEWLAEVTRRIQAGTLDTIGRAVYPTSTPGAFLIKPGKDTITIGVGRMYVDGLLVENHGSPVPGFGGWVSQSESVSRETLIESAKRSRTVVQTPAKGTADTDLQEVLHAAQDEGVRESELAHGFLGNAGPSDSWDPFLDELFGQSIDYFHQPYFPDAEQQAPFTSEKDVPKFWESKQTLIAYLDVWQREVTYLQCPDLVEKAVGIDSTGRFQTVWQIRLLPVSKGVTCATKETDIPAWRTLTEPSAARLTTGLVQHSDSGPCCLAPATAYTSIENQLYRVEIHQGGNAKSKPTFKWSCDNASVATVVTGISPDGNVLSVQSTGKDDVLRFSENDWVEIIDDWLELNGKHGELHQVASVSDANKTITLCTGVSLSSFPVDGNGLTKRERHTRLIRWDQKGIVYKSDGKALWSDLNSVGPDGIPVGERGIPVPTDGTSLILENGVTVSFGLDPAVPASFHLDPTTASFKIGDFWMLAARTDGTVEKLVKAPPRGVYHHYARLAVLTLPLSAEDPPSDCRIPWPPSCGDCSSCVTADSHNSGRWTIQNAIDKVVGAKTPGGKVCLGPGSYNIKETIKVTSANHLQITGHGMPMLMVTDDLPTNDPIVRIEDSTDIMLESLGMDSERAKENLCALLLQNASFVQVAHCLFNSPTGSDSPAFFPAIAFAGKISDSSIWDNSFANVKLGIGSANDPSPHTLTLLNIEKNKMVCTGAAVRLGSQRGLASAVQLIDNSVKSIDGFVIEFLETDDLIIERNSFDFPADTSSGNAIICGGAVISSGIISNNRMTGTAGQKGISGIVLAAQVISAQVTRNSLRAIGTGILVKASTFLLYTVFSQNQFMMLGMSAIVMTDGSIAQGLDISNNQLFAVAVSNDGSDLSQPEMAGIRLTVIQSTSVKDNVIDTIGDSVLSTSRAGIKIALAYSLGMTGNRIVNLGPDTVVKESHGIFLRTLGHVEIADNEVRRRELDLSKDGGESKDEVYQSPWSALEVRGDGDDCNVCVRGNTLESFGNISTVNVTGSMASCIFNDNHCVLDNTKDKGPVLPVVNVSARSIIATSNYLRGPGNEGDVSMHLSPAHGLTVVGNITKGKIDASVPIPTAMVPLNVTA